MVGFAEVGSVARRWCDRNRDHSPFPPLQELCFEIPDLLGAVRCSGDGGGRLDSSGGILQITVMSHRDGNGFN